MCIYFNVRDRSSALGSCSCGGSLALTLHEGCEDYDSEHQAESANNDVANGQEIVTSAHNVCCGQDETLGPIEHAYVVKLLSERIN